MEREKIECVGKMMRRREMSKGKGKREVLLSFFGTLW
jgi:hypothetical protein